MKFSRELARIVQAIKEPEKKFRKEEIRMLRKLKNQKGFTLIEVLVVVIIVAILAALAVPIYMRHVEKSRSAEAQTAIGAIRNTYKIYSQTYGSTQDYTIEKALKETNLDGSTSWYWKFEVTGNPPKKFIATSTEEFPGGPDKQVWFDVEEGKFHGYGVDQFTDPDTEGVEADTD